MWQLTVFFKYTRATFIRSYKSIWRFIHQFRIQLLLKKIIYKATVRLWNSCVCRIYLTEWWAPVDNESSMMYYHGNLQCRVILGAHMPYRCKPLRYYTTAPNPVRLNSTEPTCQLSWIGSQQSSQSGTAIINITFWSDWIVIIISHFLSVAELWACLEKTESLSWVGWGAVITLTAKLNWKADRMFRTAWKRSRQLSRIGSNLALPR